MISITELYFVVNELDSQISSTWYDNSCD